MASALAAKSPVASTRISVRSKPLTPMPVIIASSISALTTWLMAFAAKDGPTPMMADTCGVELDVAV